VSGRTCSIYTNPLFPPQARSLLEAGPYCTEVIKPEKPFASFTVEVLPEKSLTFEEGQTFTLEIYLKPQSDTVFDILKISRIDVKMASASSPDSYFAESSSCTVTVKSVEGVKEYYISCSMRTSKTVKNLNDFYIYVNMTQTSLSLSKAEYIELDLAKLVISPLKYQSGIYFVESDHGQLVITTPASGTSTVVKLNALPFVSITLNKYAFEANTKSTLEITIYGNWSESTYSEISAIKLTSGQNGYPIKILGGVCKETAGTQTIAVYPVPEQSDTTVYIPAQGQSIDKFTQGVKVVCTVYVNFTLPKGVSVEAPKLTVDIKAPSGSIFQASTSTFTVSEVTRTLYLMVYKPTKSITIQETEKESTSPIYVKSLDMTLINNTISVSYTDNVYSTLSSVNNKWTASTSIETATLTAPFYNMYNPTTTLTACVETLSGKVLACKSVSYSLSTSSPPSLAVDLLIMKNGKVNETMLKLLEMNDNVSVIVEAKSPYSTLSSTTYHIIPYRGPITTLENVTASGKKLTYAKGYYWFTKKDKTVTLYVVVNVTGKHESSSYFTSHVTENVYINGSLTSISCSIPKNEKPTFSKKTTTTSIIIKCPISTSNLGNMANVSVKVIENSSYYTWLNVSLRKVTVTPPVATFKYLKEVGYNVGVYDIKPKETPTVGIDHYNLTLIVNGKKYLEVEAPVKELESPYYYFCTNFTVEVTYTPQGSTKPKTETLVVTACLPANVSLVTTTNSTLAKLLKPVVKPIVSSKFKVTKFSLTVKSADTAKSGAIVFGDNEVLVVPPAGVEKVTLNITSVNIGGIPSEPVSATIDYGVAPDAYYILYLQKGLNMFAMPGALEPGWTAIMKDNVSSVVVSAYCLKPGAITALEPCIVYKVKPVTTTTTGEIKPTVYYVLAKKNAVFVIPVTYHYMGLPMAMPVTVSAFSYNVIPMGLSKMPLLNMTSTIVPAPSDVVMWVYIWNATEQKFVYASTYKTGKWTADKIFVPLGSIVIAYPTKSVTVPIVPTS